jgi:L-alanine-DL-glutamate epimerase-like enolase superfamily enzyme
MSVEGVQVAAYEVPTEQPEADGTLPWSATTVCVVHVQAGGATGMGWTYGPAAIGGIVSGLLAPAVTGHDPMANGAAYVAMRRAARNAVVSGLVSLAISAVDVALWDLKAKLLGVPLADLFGRCRDSVPIYGSGGFTTFSDEQLIAQLTGWVRDNGAHSVKIKIGESWGTNEDRDLERIQVARKAIGPDVALMVDANGAYQTKQAARVAGAAEAYGIDWFEEPVSSDDLAGLALLREIIHCDVTAGEYGTEPPYFQRMCAARAVDCVQIDATRAGGYTGFLAAAAVADAHRLPVSAHCAPALHAPVCAAVPNLRHIEYFADHVRTDQLLFEGVSPARDGVLTPQRDQPGHGVSLGEGAARYRATG